MQFLRNQFKKSLKLMKKSMIQFKYGTLKLKIKFLNKQIRQTRQGQIYMVLFQQYKSVMTQVQKLPWKTKQIIIILLKLPSEVSLIVKIKLSIWVNPKELTKVNLLIDFKLTAFMVFQE